MNLEQRIEKLEELHGQGGVCENHRSDLWRAITAVRERLARLETKLLVYGSMIGIGGPLVAQLLMEWWKKK